MIDRKTQLHALLLLACVPLSGSLLAQAASDTASATTTVAGAAEPAASFVLGAGDILAIDVADMPEVSSKSVKIGRDGALELPLVGSLPAAGLTTTELRAALKTRLSRYVNDPMIVINVVGNGSRFVSVIGEVNTPGLRPLDGPRTLIEIISEAGGAKADAGSRVIVTRSMRNGLLPAVDGVEPAKTESNTRLTLSLAELLDSTSTAANLPVLPGDVISIPKEQLVYVVGDVRRAGGFPLSSHESVSVLQALSLAEGSNPNASLKAAKILRPAPSASGLPVEKPINLDAILAGKAPDQALFANDVLFVPKSAAKSGSKRAAEIMLQVATGVAIYR